MKKRKVYFDIARLKIDFEPLEPEKGLVSELVKVIRDERSNNIS